jgi:hypothetical protein
MEDYNATQVAESLGLYYQDYNSMMAMTGVLIGFTFMITAVFLTIYITVGLRKG